MAQTPQLGDVCFVDAQGKELTNGEHTVNKVQAPDVLNGYKKCINGDISLKNKTNKSISVVLEYVPIDLADGTFKVGVEPEMKNTNPVTTDVQVLATPNYPYSQLVRWFPGENSTHVAKLRINVKYVKVTVSNNNEGDEEEEDEDEYTEEEDENNGEEKIKYEVVGNGPSLVVSFDPSGLTGIEDIPLYTSATANIYTLSGTLLYSNVSPSEINKLISGVYIVEMMQNGKRVYYKKTLVK
uniref:T9SS type A sorting domain-containing protein n=1 Tax=Prevotella sp. GTC17262 TaxID=3236797 RepID=A0AB33JH94_9BACT